MSEFLDVAFDTENEAGSQPFALIPAGLYKAEITIVHATKSGRGFAVKLTWTITEGEYENRLVFQSIFLEHESAKARKFGRQKFKDVLTAIGITGPISDLTLMLNHPCMVSVRITQDKNGQYPDKNEIGRVLPIPTARNGNGASPHNGVTRDMLRDAQKVQPAFKPVHEDMSDDIPF
jgi:hypothetical protein